MTTDRILYIAEPGSIFNPLVGALRSVGYDVVITSSPSQAVALLFLMSWAAGVLISHESKEHAGFYLAHTLRAMCPHVPIIFLCNGAVTLLPSADESCLPGEPKEKLIDTVQRLLNASEVVSGRCSPKGQAA